ncbi:AIPR family protein [Aureimonas sp. N4]|uniref:AIPR family protein n=1 Tax=Aureimonas sp. N4 TaxID=1638165 RepID=UPI0007833439|nr:AIPR family protein [Aureimonas sp. N4]
MTGADTTSSWNTAYRQREDLSAFGSAGLALFAMALKFGYDDLETIGADAVVDGPDDKGCDVVYIDRDLSIAIVAQAYRAESPRASAQDNKAATLRQGLSYLLEVAIDKVPERLKASAIALRTAISEGDVDQIHIWFVHNCPASPNVAKEVSAVEETASSVLKSRFKDRSVSIYAEEISSPVLEKLYTDTNTPILVNDPIEFETAPGLAFDEGDWHCLVVPLQLRLLQDLYTRHKTNLFSANVRDFLGVKAGDSNINYQMQKSLREKPTNFFVYNNGLTVLTHKIEQESIEGNRVRVRVHGLSIVNGAQTTGTIGTSNERPPESAYVLARFISTQAEELVADVVRYNNSQNAVTASDFRSTDPTQRRLVDEMKVIPDAEYDGGRRGGVSAAIKRRPKLLPSYSVGQALATFHGSPTVAYNEKSAIWSRDGLYSRFFNDSLTATHIVFAYGLLRAIESEKNDLRTKESAGVVQLTSAEKAKLAFYRKRGSAFLLAAAVAECLETIIETVVPNRFAVSFGNKVSPDEAVRIWSPTVQVLSSLHTYLDPAFSDGLKNQERVADTTRAFSQLVASLRVPYATFFDTVKNAVVRVH